MSGDPRPSAWNVPNLLTLAGLGCGFYGALSAAGGQASGALLGIALALVLDRLDGMAARALGQSSEVGAQLDSLADMVSFVVAPACLVAAMGTGLAGQIAALAYVVAGAWRLAAFHHVGMTTFRGRAAFVGLPTPAGAAGVVVAFVACHTAGLGGAAVLPLVMAAAAGGFVASFPYPRNGPVLAVTVVLLIGAYGAWFLG